ncbi:MAG: HAMP domain-containing protein [Chitinophagaceae bacterium]|nr:HAMP domain-containing protein [Oligoflexus sp.]
MMHSKFFWKNFLSFVVIICFTTFVVSYLLILQAKQFIESTTTDSLQEKLVIFAPYFEDGVSWREPENVKKIIAVAHEAKTRLTVLDQNENLLLESDPIEVQPSENQKTRPELKDAKIKSVGIDKRISPISKLETLYSAKQITTSKGPLLLRVGVPMHKLDDRLKDIFVALGVGAAFGMLLSVLIALILVRRITDPVSEMTKVAEAISHGNYTARIRRLPSNELGSLGEAINRLAEAVEANISRREKMEKIRREFSSNISHELKTPLTSIKGYADTLLEGAIDDKENNLRFLRIINNNVERMISLVNESLNLATIEANEGIVELTPVDWKPIIQEAINRHQIRMNDKNIKFKTNFAAESSLVKGDRKAMFHILDNLLQNAVSYTPASGEVELNVDHSPRFCELSVRDTGIGIAKADQSRIFERFYRVDAARTRNEGGTGLGLAIVKHLVIQIQGTISVDSELNRGSIFTVRLPSA